MELHTTWASYLEMLCEKEIHVYVVKQLILGHCPPPNLDAGGACAPDSTHGSPGGCACSASNNTIIRECAGTSHSGLSTEHRHSRNRDLNIHLCDQHHSAPKERCLHISYSKKKKKVGRYCVACCVQVLCKIMPLPASGTGATSVCGSWSVPGLVY